MIQVFKQQIELFVLLFENSTDREVHEKHYIPKVEIKDYNAVIERRNFFDQPLKMI